MRLRGTVLVFLKILVGRHEVEGLVRSDLVIEALIVVEGEIGGFDGEVAVVAVPELDAGGVVGAFDVAVELGSFRGQHEERDFQFFAGLLEVGAELAAAVDLGGDERERELRADGFEEAFGVAGGGAAEDLDDHLLADGGDGLELLQSLAVAGGGQVVDLNEFAGLFGLLPPGQAPGVAVEAPRLLIFVRPRQNAQGWMRPRRTPLARIRPTVDSLRSMSSRSSRTRSFRLPMKGKSRRKAHTLRSIAAGGHGGAGGFSRTDRMGRRSGIACASGRAWRATS